MNKAQLLALIEKKSKAKETLRGKIEASEDVKELRTLQADWNALTEEISELQSMADAIIDGQTPANVRTAVVNGEIPGVVVASVGGQKAISENEQRAQAAEEVEKRGKDLMESRAVTVGADNIVTPAHTSSDVKPTFEEVSGLLDRVYIKNLHGGESFKQAYVVGYGEGGYTAEGADYDSAEPVFGYAQINKAKVTAYAEDTEELQKLAAAAYHAEVMRGIRIACRKKITRQILIGDGAANRLVGIFSAAVAGAEGAIDPATDLGIATIDNKTLDDIVFGYGGDEAVEDVAVLVLNKKDLKAFSQLRTTDGKKFHTIVANGNRGTIDGVPFIINSACRAISDPVTTVGQFAMAYGPLSNYMLCVFSEMEVMRSTDYKFKQGMIAHKGSVFLGGNVVSKNGFLRVKKAATV